jgi:PDZ domain-containing protein
MIVNQTEEPAPPPEPRRRFHLVRVIVAGVVAGALVIGASLVPIPFLFTIHPGPTPNAFQRIKIDASTFPSQGSIHITTVELLEPSAAEAAWALISPEVDLILRSQIYPPGSSRREVDREIAAQMSESQYAATVAALHQLGYTLENDGVLIRTTLSEAPAAEHLKAGDVIVGVDGKPVVTVSQLSELVQAHPIGDQVTVSVRRGTELKEFSVKTIQSISGPARPIIGVEPLQNFKLPFSVSIDAGAIGGPSAGLMFALSIIDLLDPEDLTGGKVIAGTGEIDPAGNVRPVGGIEQKVKAADRLGALIFLVPADEVEEAKAAVDGEMRVLGVGSVSDAVAALRG